MNVEIISLNPFVVSMNLYNVLGEIDGHPKVMFDMATGEYSLYHDMTFHNLVTMSPHPLKGEKIELDPESPMNGIIEEQIIKRIKSTGFHDPEATQEFNPHYQRDPKYPSYFFIMWNEDKSVHFIGESEYKELREWKKSLT